MNFARGHRRRGGHARHAPRRRRPPRRRPLPGVTGKRLSAYAAAGIGSDHECVSPTRPARSSRAACTCCREATNAPQPRRAAAVVTPAQRAGGSAFCTDDRTPVELLDRGSVDELRSAGRLAPGHRPREAIPAHGDAEPRPRGSASRHLGDDRRPPGRRTCSRSTTCASPEARLVFSRRPARRRDGTMLARPKGKLPRRGTGVPPCLDEVERGRDAGAKGGGLPTVRGATRPLRDCVGPRALGRAGAGRLASA
jgi:hypothetical protein